jgi:hypothetical protein
MCRDLKRSCDSSGVRFRSGGDRAPALEFEIVFDGCFQDLLTLADVAAGIDVIEDRLVAVVLGHQLVVDFVVGAERDLIKMNVGQ